MKVTHTKKFTKVAHTKRWKKHTSENGFNIKQKNMTLRQEKKLKNEEEYGRRGRKGMRGLFKVKKIKKKQEKATSEHSLAVLFVFCAKQ